MPHKFRKLVDRHRDRVYTLAYYSLGSHEEAEDATQEVFIRLWRHVREVEEKTLAAWLRRVTQNVCIDMSRRRNAYRARVVANGEGDALLYAEAPGGDPEAMAQASELRERIELALASLEEPYRSIVISREIEDMKYDEICEFMRMPLNTVKSYLHRGRRMLRDRLKELRP